MKCQLRRRFQQLKLSVKIHPIQLDRSLRPANAGEILRFILEFPS